MNKDEIDRSFLNSSLSDHIKYQFSHENIIPTSTGCLGLRINQNFKVRSNGHCVEAAINYPYEENDWVIYSYDISIPEMCPPFSSEKFYYISCFEQQLEGDEQDKQEFLNLKTPLGLKIGSLFNKDYINIVYKGVPDQDAPVIKIKRGEFFNVTFSVKWSQGEDGRARVIVDGESYDFSGSNMYNSKPNKLRLGHFRDVSIQTENDLYFRNPSIMKIDPRALGI